MNTGSEEMYPFPIVKKGYDPEAVDSYIEELLEQNRFLNSRNADLERRLAETQELISRYTKAEDTLRQNIADSKRAAAAMIVEARQRSSALLEDARNECGKIIARKKSSSANSSADCAGADSATSATTVFSIV